MGTPQQQQQQRVPKRRGTFFTLVLAGVAAWYIGPPLGSLLYPLVLYRFFDFQPSRNSFIGGAIIFFIIAAIGDYVFSPTRQKKNDGEIKGTITPIGQYLIGCCFRIPVYFIPVIWMYAYLMNPDNTNRVVQNPDGAYQEATSRLVLFIALVVLWHFYGVDRFKTILGKASLPFRDYFRARQRGRGGSARFAGILEEWSHPVGKHKLIAGRGSYDPSRIVAFEDDRGQITMAGARSGKGRCQILPNLLNWSGSAIVIDPRGANAAVSAARRGNGRKFVRRVMGQPVYCLNPFNLNDHIAWMPLEASFNPLSFLDPADINYKARLDRIASALIVDEPGGHNDHFTRGCRGFIRGLIDYFVKTEKDKATLGHVRDALNRYYGPIRPDPHNPSKPYLLKLMVAVGGLALEGASAMIMAGEKEFGGFMTTAIIQTDWLARGAPLRKCLEKSEFTLASFKVTPSTLYVILPTHVMVDTPQFMRLFIELVVMEASVGGKGKVPILLLMDEFSSLGPMPSIVKGAADLAGYKVKLWPIIQNLGQIKNLYPQNWETFFNNTGLASLWAPNDNESAEYVISKIGQRTYQTVRVQLRTEQEIQQEASRRSGRMIIAREGEDPMILRRMRYDEDPYFRGLYAQDPDY